MTLVSTTLVEDVWAEGLASWPLETCRADYGALLVLPAITSSTTTAPKVPIRSGLNSPETRPTSMTAFANISSEVFITILAMQPCGLPTSPILTPARRRMQVDPYRSARQTT